MLEAPIPKNEKERLEQLLRYEILDTPEEKSFDEITHLASSICDSPIALVSLVDENRQWFKSHHGLNAHETSRSVSFCGHAINDNEVFVVENANEDSRFSDNPLVTGDPKVIFYAGAPLINEEGTALGTLCVIDHKPKKLTECQVNSLKILAKQVVSLMDLRLANHQLENTNKQLSTLTQNMAEGMVLQGSDGKIIEFNDSALILLGLTPDQLKGRTSLDPRWRSIRENGETFPGDEHPAMVSLKTGKSIRNVIMGIHHHDGQMKWLSINSTPIYHNGGKTPIQALSTFNDITDLKKNETKFKELFVNMPVGMIEVGSDMKIIESNPAFSELTGYPLDELRTKSILDITYPDDRASTLNNWEKVAISGIKLEGLTKRYLKKSGELAWVRLNSKSYDFESKQGARTFTVIEDITEQKKLEESIREQEGKLLQASKMSSLGEMAAGMAHEINNPLAIIAASAGLIKKYLKDSERQELDRSAITDRLSKIEYTVDRIAKIVKGLRSFARNAEQDPKVDLQFSQIIDDTLALCNEKFKFNSIELRIKIEQDPTILGRSSQLSQVLLNLLNNSFDAISETPSSWVEIKTTVANDFLRISVTDSGTGIPQQVQAKLMQPFFTTKEVGKGTGLGLSISRGIIAEHGGKFYYDSNSLNTCFVIELPIYEK